MYLDLQINMDLKSRMMTEHCS